MEREHFERFIELAESLIHNQKKLMAAIDNLNSNISMLTTVVGQVVTALGTAKTGTSDAVIQTAADAVAAQTAALQTALTPPTS